LNDLSGVIAIINDTYDLISELIVCMDIVPISVTFPSRVRVVDQYNVIIGVPASKHLLILLDCI
jgi:hypothetical protein